MFGVAVQLETLEAVEAVSGGFFGFGSTPVKKDKDEAKEGEEEWVKRT